MEHQYIISTTDIKEIARSYFNGCLDENGEIKEPDLRDCILENLQEDISDWFEDFDLADIMQDLQQDAKENEEDISETIQAQKGDY